MEGSIEKTMKADKAGMSDAEKMEPSIEKTTNADKAVMSDAEQRANFIAFIEDCKIAAEKAAGKKKSKTVMRRLTQKHIDAVLAVPIETTRPGWSEEQLARVKDRDVRDRIRDSLAASAAVVDKSREELRLEKERIRSRGAPDTRVR
ncbi:unnamed protein product [Miscanthus lutarioriparius]|uniref:Uncharacterized protein n=1 Tax=Miscanthus lutarioriparius TaxID=422564 RepID=A0A811MMU8_9POAL|nr:unnamed protein product [Miscanthus lutarioriparius]